MIEHFKQLALGMKIVVILLVIILGLIILTLLFHKSPTSTSKLLPPSLTSLDLKGQGTDPSAYLGSSVHFLTYYNNFLYYLSDGYSTFYKVSLDGTNKQAISDPLIAKIDGVAWSPDKTSAILTIENDKYFLGKNNSPFFSPNDTSDTTVWYYDFQTKQAKKLNSSINTIAFSPNGQKIAYFKRSEFNNKLYTASPDGSNETAIVSTLKAFQTEDAFLNDNQIISYTNPEGYGSNYVYLIDLNTKQVIQLNSDGLTFGDTTSPKGDKIITTTMKQQDIVYMPYLSVIDVQNKQLKVLDQLSAPSPVSAWAPDGSSFFVIDNGNLLEYDASTYQKQSQPLPGNVTGSKIDPNSLVITTDNNTAYFTAEGVLYKITL